MKKTFKRMAAVLAAAMMAAAMVVPAYAAEAPLLETKDGKAIDDAALKTTDLSQYGDFFTAIGATAEQAKAIYLAGTVNLKVGESVELLLAQPARAADAKAAPELLVGKQMAVTVSGPADGATVKNDNGEYLPLTFTGKANGTDLYVANIAPYGLCAYKFVVGSGEGVTNTNPKLYATATDAVKTETAKEETVKTINYNPAPVGVALSNKGSNLLSQGGVKVDGKQVDGVNIYGHAKYSPSAAVAAPKKVRVGMLNPEDIITVDNNSKPVAKSEPKPTRIGMLNAEDIITIDNSSKPVAKSEPKPTRIGMLNAEDIITIDNSSTPVAKSEPKPTRIGMLNAEEIITIDNSSTPVTKSEPKVVRNGMLNPEDIIQIL